MPKGQHSACVEPSEALAERVADMATPNTPNREAEYSGRGWRTVPVPAGTKRPVVPGWNTQAFAPDDFGVGENIAVVLGSRSGWLVDIDLDCAEAIELADLYLPQTGAEFGRASRPRCHRLYIGSGAAFEAFSDPLIDGKNTLVELRADGASGGAHLSLLPPSIADGEQREWASDTIAPLVVNAKALRLQVARLAVGCLVMRYISEHAARRPSPDLPSLLLEFDRPLGRQALNWLGLPDPDAPQRYLRRRREMSRRDLDLAEIVHAIPNRCSWEEWNAIGMAIFAASGGSGDGQVIFDDFSAKSGKYDPHAVVERWRNYGRSPPSRIGLGFLVRLAREAGWRPGVREAS
jgi:Primase C terminal 2 (PriCT-2)/Bifunctional DNA primase/polymerase, N-terminal